MGQPAGADELSEPLSSWYSEACEHISRYWRDWAQIASGTAWVHMGDSDYQATTPLILKREAEAALRQLPSYERLDRAVTNSQTLAPLLGRLVGTHSAASLFTSWTMARAVLPRVVDLINGRAPSFADIYQVRRQQLVDQAVDYQTMCPLQGVAIETAPLELAPGIIIDRLSPAETCTALETGAIPTLWPHSFEATQGKSFALKKVASVPIIIRDPKPTSTAARKADNDPFIWLARAYEEVVTLQQCLALMTGARIQISATLAIARDEGFLRTDGGVQVHVLSPWWAGDDIVNIDAAGCLELQGIWKVLTGDYMPRDKALSLAVRRLAFATQRALPEDRLLDVLIAAEAFYRGGAGSRRDTRSPGVQLAERVAAFSEGTLPGWDKNDVQLQMRRGYKLRSAIVHGDEPRQQDLKIRHQPAELTGTIGAVEAIVRAGLLKAVGKLLESPGELRLPWNKDPGQRPPSTASSSP